MKSPTEAHGSQIQAIVAVTLAMFVVLALDAPSTLLTLVVAVAALPLLASPAGRLFVFVLGALFVFQTSSGVTAPKMAYFATATLIITVATARSIQHVNTDWGLPFRPALQGATVIGITIALAAATGLLHGNPAASVLRDGMTYILIAGGVPVAIDAASRLNLSTADHITVFVTLVSGASFAVTFLSVRDAGQVGIERIGLASMMALSVGVSLGLVRGLGVGPIRWRWLFYAALLIALVLVTGTRTGLVLFAAFLGVTGGREWARVPPCKVLTGGMGVILVLTLSLVLSANTVTSPEFLSSRVEAATNTLTNGTRADASGVIRARATQFALEVWGQNSLMGQGLGQTFPNPAPNSPPVDFQMDTPALFLAKFGLLGTVLLVVGMLLITRPALGRIDLVGRLPEQTIMMGAAFVWAATLPFGAPSEDKGFSLAVLLSVLLMAASTRQHLSGLDKGYPVGPPLPLKQRNRQ